MPQGERTQEQRDLRMETLLPSWLAPASNGASTVGLVSVGKSPNSSLPSLTVRRNRKGIGRYLKELRVLVVNDERDRDAARRALAEAGFAVLPPLRPLASGEQILHVRVAPIGAWGNVLLFEGEFEDGRPAFRLALFLMDTGALFTVSTHLFAPLTRRLDLMGLKVETAATTGLPADLADKLDWDDRAWGWTPAAGPYIRPAGEPEPETVVRRLTDEIAAELPAEVVAAMNERLTRPVVDPFDRRTTMHWEHQNGVLAPRQIAELRATAPTDIALPAGWEDCWRSALQLSAVHAPSLAALDLHQAFPEWWTTLPLGTLRDGIWLLGHSGAKPVWVRQDLTGSAEARLRTAVALIVRAVPDLDWLLPVSREKHPCAACGRAFEKGMVQAGDVHRLRTSRICHLCLRVAWMPSSAGRNRVQEAGAVAAIIEITRVAGHVVSASMVDDIDYAGKISPEAWFVLGLVLPGPTEGAWGEWLAKSGLLGEGWRPSRGYVSTANDGHLCRSLLERIIDDFFFGAGISHEPEPPYPYDPALNPHGMRADWKLADGTFVEAAGLMTEADYAEKIAKKQALAAKHGIGLLILTHADLPRLPDIFGGATTK